MILVEINFYCSLDLVLPRRAMLSLVSEYCLYGARNIKVGMPTDSILSLWNLQGRIVADFEAEVEDDLEPLFRRGDVSCSYSYFS